MGEETRDLGYWLYFDIENNTYLKKLYCKLILQYMNSLLKKEYLLEEVEICHLQRFADVLSKSTSKEKSSFHYFRHAISISFIRETARKRFFPKP